MKAWFKSIESDPENTTYALEKVLSELTVNEEGLIPVIAQDEHTQAVLMFAWMNRETLKKSIKQR